MGYYHHLFKAVRFCVFLTILVLSVNVCAFAAKDDDMFLFVSSQNVPPPSCPENEIYKNCIGNCTDCENRGICDFGECKQKGCDCIMNFVRLKPGGPCEHVHKCPVPQCGENEVFRECGPICEWCGVMRCRILQCEHKCYCKEGYLRDWEGKCVPADDCPPKLGCGRDEEKADSGLVDEYCLHADDEEVSNATETKERCYCKEGFKRNGLGHCVDVSNCEYVKCLNEETYQLCPKKCNTTCSNYGDTTCKEDGQCYPGCFCQDGYLMNDYRKCVPLENCPPGSNPFVPTAGPTTTQAMTESTTPISTKFSTPSTQTTESDTSSSTPAPTTAQTSETTLVDETTETSVGEDEDTKTTVPVTSTTETAEQSSTEEKEESKEETQTTTQKPRSQKGRRNEKEKRLTIKDKKATTPMEEDMDGDND